jgi:diguanylate cyclase (GGDEF)-like protein/PAS domain S-box-containing protein
MAGAARQLVATSENTEAASSVLDSAILLRKWQAARPNNGALPAYEDVALGSLGRLADYLAVVQGEVPERFRFLRGGRRFKEAVGAEVAGTEVSALVGDFAKPIIDLIYRGLVAGAPVSSRAHQAREGVVSTFEMIALPLACRWGAPLIAVYVRELGAKFNLLGNLFRATDEGMIALSAVRDAAERVSDFRIIDCNAAAARQLRVSESDLRWQRLSEAAGGLFAAPIIEQFVASHLDGARRQIEIAAPYGSAVVAITPVGELLSATFTDIRGIKQREVSFRLLFESNPVPMWLYEPDALKVIKVNDAAVAHYGYSREQFESMTLFNLCPRDEWELQGEVARAVRDFHKSDRTWRHIKADHGEIEVLTYGREVNFGDRRAILSTILDVTERKQAEARIAHMAHHDDLTNLANRMMFNERLTEAIAHIRCNGESLAVHCIDLDHFKTVNDTLGHPIGDRLLRAVAERMKACLRDTDLIARLGGDEFSIVQWPITGPNDADMLAHQLIEVISRPYELDGQEIIIGASIGMALGPADGDTAETLLRNADMALYRAKGAGRGDAHFFEAEMDRQIQARRGLELDLRKALGNDELELYYQPLVNLETSEVCAFEALLRWHHPTRGAVPPNEFIPIAEDIGLIAALSHWVLRTACVEATKWPDTVKVAVNLSPVQFRSKGLVESVVAALAHSGLNPGRLELEITESVLLSETEANLATLHQLREIGARISLDDFGTGYSSLSYLRSFPFDKIKIDRSFVRDLGLRPDSMAIIRAIVGLGRSLNIATAVEGVETQEQLELLKAECCTEVQGFLFSSPVPAARVTKLLPRALPLAVSA